MPAVALDTNALMMPVELDVRVFDELERLLGDPDPVVPRAVLDELESLAAGAGEEARAARVGLDLAGRCRVAGEDDYRVDPGSAAPAADDALVDLGRAGAVEYAVTNDRPLRDRLLAAGVPVIGVRGRNRLAITQP